MASGQARRYRVHAHREGLSCWGCLGGCRRLLEVSRGSQRLPEAPGGSQRLPEAPRGGPEPPRRPFCFSWLWFYWYFEKGEIKENYYNPQNFFNEVHIISFTQKDIDELKVQKLVGKAKIQKKTRSMVFLTCELTVENKIVATASGVWKILIK